MKIKNDTSLITTRLLPKKAELDKKNQTAYFASNTRMYTGQLHLQANKESRTRVLRKRVITSRSNPV